MADGLAAMQAQLAGLLAHEHAPLALAQAASGIDASGPLFTSIFNYRHNPAPGDGPGAGLDGIEVLYMRERSNYPLSVSVDQVGTGFAITVAAVAPADPRLVCSMLATA